MVRQYVNVQFQVKPLSTGTSSSQTKKNFLKNTSMCPPRCVPSLESIARKKRVGAVVAAVLDKSRGSNLS